MYQVFEHTADLGLRIEADSFEELFVEAGRALFSVLVRNLDEVRPLESRRLTVPRDEPAYWLADWLRELLYVFDTHRWLFSRFEVRLDESQLEALCWGEPIDRTRHYLDHEVKAITYHGLVCRQRDDGRWEAEVIVDI
jgi:SHS2 domain-containing protein